MCNGFAFDVIAVLTPTVVDGEKCFSLSRHLCTVIPVGNVLAVPLLPAETVQQFSLDNLVSRSSKKDGVFVGLKDYRKIQAL